MKILAKTAGQFVLTMMAGPFFTMTPAAAAGVGDFAPNIDITNNDGNVRRLSEFRGRKPVYLVFWNTWCMYCIKKTARYRKLQEQFGDKIEIIAINTSWSDSPEKMRSFEKRFNTNYSTAFDFGELITDRYQVTAVPTEFIVDVNGVIRYRNSVPKYVVAHLPDWLLQSGPSIKTVPPEHTE